MRGSRGKLLPRDALAAGMGAASVGIREQITPLSCEECTLLTTFRPLFATQDLGALTGAASDSERQKRDI